MVTVFHVLNGALAVAGLIVGSEFLGQYLGVAGKLAGGLIGVWFGLLAGDSLHWVTGFILGLPLRGKPVEVLHRMIREESDSALLVVLELRRRGTLEIEDLLIVCGRLGADEFHSRLTAGVAIQSVYPDLVKQSGYFPNESAPDCARKAALIVEGLERLFADGPRES